MIFMTQSGLTGRSHEREWDAWYADHLDKMLTVPEVLSAQRFRAQTANYPSSLAMYTFASDGVFTDPQYLHVRGMGKWVPLIDRAQYQRNLFAGLEAAPCVSNDEVLVVADRRSPDEIDFGRPVAWLRAVAVDRSTPYRGIAVLQRDELDHVKGRQGLGIYLPITPVHRKTTHPPRTS